MANQVHIITLSAGPVGPPGPPGPGVPPGGSEGQVLTKSSTADFDTIWVTPSGGGGGGGASSLDGLSDVDISTDPPNAGQVLKFNGVEWIASDDNVGSGSAAELNDMTDVDTTSSPPSVGDVLKWNGSQWVPDVDAGAGDVFYYNYVSVPAGAMVPRATSGAAPGTRENSNNLLMADFLAFDKDANEYAQFQFTLPDDIDVSAPLKCKLYWTGQTSNANNVVWDVAAVTLGNNELIHGPNFPAGQHITDGFLGVNEVHETAATGDILPSDAVAGDMIWVQVKREAADAGDLYGGDAELLGVVLQYRRNPAANVAW